MHNYDAMITELLLQLRAQLSRAWLLN